MAAGGGVVLHKHVFVVVESCLVGLVGQFDNVDVVDSLGLLLAVLVELLDLAFLHLCHELAQRLFFISAHLRDSSLRLNL